MGKIRSYLGVDIAKETSCT